jgi:predicted Zn-dependent peptidase
LRDGELAKVKRQIAGNIVLGMEGMSSRMQRMTKNELFHGREIPIDETLAKIDAVTELQVRDLCAQILNPERLGVTAIGPFNA